MFRRFLSHFLLYFFGIGLVAAIFSGWPIYVFQARSQYHWISLSIAFVVVMAAAYRAAVDLWKESDKPHQEKLAQETKQHQEKLAQETQLRE